MQGRVPGADWWVGRVVPVAWLTDLSVLALEHLPPSSLHLFLRLHWPQDSLPGPPGTLPMNLLRVPDHTQAAVCLLPFWKASVGVETALSLVASAVLGM